MGEIAIGLALGSFVAGGGVFIFWPDLKAKLKMPKKKKQVQSEIQQMESIYSKHYTDEDRYLEAAEYVLNEKYSSITKAMSAIDLRKDCMIYFLKDTSSTEFTCPVCKGHNQKHYHEVRFRCTCNGFEKKAKAMARDAYFHYNG